MSYLAQVQTVLLISIHIKISLKPLTHSEWILTSCFKITKPIFSLLLPPHLTFVSPDLRMAKVVILNWTIISVVVRSAEKRKADKNDTSTEGDKRTEASAGMDILLDL